MSQTRRELMATTGAAALGAVPFVASSQAHAAQSSQAGDFSSAALLRLFADLPGDVALKIVAPPANGDQGLRVAQNSGRRMFVGSAIKTFVLGENLRRADSPNVVATLSDRFLDLDASVWNEDSATLNPPNLIGRISQRTALEAMILHSDNTATDISIKHVGIGRVRAFIARVGLKDTLVPDSTRAFFGYLLGVKDPKRFSWDELQALTDAPEVNPPLNDVQTLASSADDFVSYYSRALRGRFFEHDATLNEFRRILAMGDAIWLVPLPLGVSAFVKGGSIDVPGFHAICVPGGMFFDGRWVYFCLTINWYAQGETDPPAVAAFLKAASTALTMVKNALERR
jgi:beta-lactamase class A